MGTDMPRDMGLVRRLLLMIEADQTDNGFIKDMDGRSDSEIAYHLELMADAGLLKAKRVADGDAPVRVYGMTWKGHDFLDAVRSDGVWSRVTERLGAVGGSASFEVVKQLAVKVSANLLGLDQQ